MRPTRALLAALLATGLAVDALPGPAAAAAAPAPLPFGADLPPVCVLLDPSPDAGHGYCVDADGPCFLAEYRTYIWGYEVTCVQEHPL